MSKRQNKGGAGTTSGNKQTENDLQQPLIDKDDQESSMNSSAYGFYNSEAPEMKFPDSMASDQITKILG